MNDTLNEATRLNPQSTALLVMDYQPGILGRLEDADALTTRAATAIATMREAGATIAFVRVAFRDTDFEAMPSTSKMAERVRLMPREVFDADAPGTQVDERVSPEEGDIVVRKVRVGAFGTTDLDRQLREWGIDTLVLAGISTSGVVLSTVRDASDRDYRLFVLTDATADPDPEIHDFLVRQILPRQADMIEAADLAGLLAF